MFGIIKLSVNKNKIRFLNSKTNALELELLQKNYQKLANKKLLA